MMFSILPSLAALHDAAAREVVERAHESVEARGQFAVALAGGGTPRGAYELLATRYADEMPWEHTDIYFGDERCVEPDHPASNYGMVKATLLDRVKIPAANVHPIRATGAAAAQVAEEYEGLLRRTFDLGTTEAASLVAREGAMRHEVSDAVIGDVPPTFDLALLGVGEDGHTASLFPGSPSLDEQRHWVLPAIAPPGAAVRERITLTFAALNRSRAVLVLCAGELKRDVLREIRVAGDAARRFPAVRARGIVATRWLVDAEAAGPALRDAK